MFYQSIRSVTFTARIMKFSIKDFFSKCDPEKTLMENFIFCIVILYF